ncbi:hypothetical protein [Sulfitobacter pontiacus]|uniref:hypothetical protein n=1 Tax=Sulfitobacter pontiacus TaxID=60137 RepID=UPI00326DD269
MLKKTAIAAVAALTIATAMASPAQALSKGAKIGIATGIFALGAAAAHAHGGGYYGDHGHGYRGGRHYRRSARRCARRFGWHTFRWERCMYRRGY